MIWRTEIIDQAVLKFYILPQIYVALVPLVVEDWLNDMSI